MKIIRLVSSLLQILKSLSLSLIHQHYPISLRINHDLGGKCHSRLLSSIFHLLQGYDEPIWIACNMSVKEDKEASFASCVEKL